MFFASTARLRAHKVGTPSVSTMHYALGREEGGPQRFGRGEADRGRKAPRQRKYPHGVQHRCVALRTPGSKSTRHGPSSENRTRPALDPASPRACARRRGAPRPQVRWPPGRCSGMEARRAAQPCPSAPWAPPARKADEQWKLLEPPPAERKQD
eukprot:scaffold3319_cov427-Prasinococcus_capsulatus_cf.AAC.1